MTDFMKDMCDLREYFENLKEANESEKQNQIAGEIAELHIENKKLKKEIEVYHNDNIILGEITGKWNKKNKRKCFGEYFGEAKFCPECYALEPCKIKTRTSKQ